MNNSLRVSNQLSLLLVLGCLLLVLNGRAQTTPPFNTNDSISNILLPNVFTPNGDSINDVFRPILDEITDLDCTIYDRWGNLIYQSSRLRAAWDGHTDAGQLCCDGTYFCVISATGIDGRKYKEKVALQLISGLFYK